MPARMTNFGFGTLAKPSGKPATIKTPKVYDFTNGKRPKIPKEERSDLRPGKDRADASPVPTPDIIDGRRK